MVEIVIEPGEYRVVAVDVKKHLLRLLVVEPLDVWRQGAQFLIAHSAHLEQVETILMLHWGLGHWKLLLS